MSTDNTSTAPVALGSVTVAVIGLVNLFQLAMGASLGLQGPGPKLEGIMGWLLVTTAVLSLLGILQAVRGARRFLDGDGGGAGGVRRGVHMSSGMAIFSVLPTAVVIGFPFGVAAFGLRIALGFVLPRIVRGFGG